MSLVRPFLSLVIATLVIAPACAARGDEAAPAATAEADADGGDGDMEDGADGEDGDADDEDSDAEADLPTIEADDAADHVGEECIVEMVVRAGRLLADKGVCFLNSRQSRRDEGNFTVVIFRDGLRRFTDAGIEDPALEYLDRTIRVRGVVAEHKGQPQIVVKDPEQIELAEEPAAAAEAD